LWSSDLLLMVHNPPPVSWPQEFGMVVDPNFGHSDVQESLLVFHYTNSHKYSIWLSICLFVINESNWDRIPTPSVLVFSLSSHRHPSICILFTSRFTSYNKHYLTDEQISTDIDCIKNRLWVFNVFETIDGLRKQKIRIPPQWVRQIDQMDYSLMMFTQRMVRE
jgi:hypothetical protein